jgi:hypothetical protein
MICDTVASSVDAERSFSCGRLQVNHLQHNISSQSFKAKMAVGSWANTPLFPRASAEQVIRSRMRQETGEKVEIDSALAPAGPRTLTGDESDSDVMILD